MKKVAANLVLEAIERKLEKGAPVLPIEQVNSEGEQVTFRINPALEEDIEKCQPKEILESFAGGEIEIKFKKASIPYIKTNEVGVSSKEKYRLLYTMNDMSLGELFKLARVAKELSVLAQDLLYLNLISRTDLKNIIPFSGKFLYNNVIDPEAFKSENAEFIKDSTRNSKSKNNSVISNTLSNYDDMVNINYLLSQFRRTEDINFIKFCKDYENKDFGEGVFAKDPNIGDSESVPVMSAEAELKFQSIGNVNSEGVNILKQLDYTIVK